VRSLGRDIGRKLGCLGYISELRRIACGPFVLDQATDIHAFDDKCESFLVLPIETALGHMPMLDCSVAIATRLKQGQRLRLNDVQSFLSCSVRDDDVVCVVCEKKLIGLAWIQGGVVRPYRMFG
jgi:tRNA pseudouridine55 synthase